MKDLRPAIIRAHEKGKGVREIARFLDIQPMTVSRAIKRFEETGSNKDREPETRKVPETTKMNEQAKLKRLQRVRALYRRFSRGRHRQIIFSDEKLFDIQQVGV